MNIYRRTTEQKLAYFILLTIGFQAFPALPIGGANFKIYELLGLIVLFLSFKPYSNMFLKVCMAYFVICPFISLLWGWAYMGYPFHYFVKYATYPEAQSAKMNYYLFPIFALIFMFANYAVISTIVRDEWLYKHIPHVIKSMVIIGSVISLFSLFAMAGMSVKNVLPFLDAANGDYGGMRSLGFSKEPSTYVLFQTWIVLFTMAAKKLFTKRWWRILMALNLISLVFTFSSALVAFVLVIVVSPILIFRLSRKTKIYTLVAIGLGIVIVAGIVIYMGLADMFLDVFQDKIIHFFTPSDYTTDSGAFRNLTSRIGYKIWELSPIFGVGVPMSTYYMHLYENKMGIVTWGEEIGPTHFPQNAYSQTLAELGILGFIALCLILFLVVRNLWKLRRKDKIAPYLLMGVICNAAYLFSNATLYSFYLWIFIAFSAGYCSYIEKGIKIRRIRTKIMNKQKKDNHENSNRLPINRK